MLPIVQQSRLCDLPSSGHLRCRPTRPHSIQGEFIHCCMNCPYHAQHAAPVGACLGWLLAELQVEYCTLKKCTEVGWFATSQCVAMFARVSLGPLPTCDRRFAWAKADKLRAIARHRLHPSFDIMSCQRCLICRVAEKVQGELFCTRIKTKTAATTYLMSHTAHMFV